MIGSAFRFASSTLSWTTIWPALVWGLALGAKPAPPSATAIPILVALALDIMRATGAAGRLGLATTIRTERDCWSWRLGPPAETLAILLATTSLALSLRWLIPPLVVPRGAAVPLLPLFGALAAAFGVYVAVHTLVTAQRRGYVRLTETHLTLKRRGFETSLNRSDIDRVRFDVLGPNLQVIASVRGRGAIHVLIVPTKWTTANNVRSFAETLAARLGVSLDAIG